MDRKSCFVMKNSGTFEAFINHMTLEGPELRFYPNGNIESICTFINGKIHGEYINYHFDGYCITKSMFINDIETGLCVKFDSNGNIWQKYNLIDSKVVGPRTIYYFDGTNRHSYKINTCESIHYDDDGELVITIIDAKDAKKCSFSKLFIKFFKFFINN